MDNIIIIKSPYEKHRSQITEILNKKYPNGIGAEIGVFKGEFSKKILEKWNCSKYYLIDLWSNDLTNNNSIQYDEDWAKDNKNHNINYVKTQENIKKYKNRVKIIRNYSHLAAKEIDNESIDFIYLDANHSYEGIKMI